MFASISLPTNLAVSESLSWDLAKQIIQSQHNLAMYGLTVLVGVAVVLLAGSWIWHFRLHKRELEEAIKSLKAALTAEGKRDFMELTKKVNDELEKIKKEIEKNVEQRMTRFDKTGEERMILFNAEKARLFGFANAQLKAWEAAVSWWTEAVVGYAKMGEEKLVRAVVDMVIVGLDQCKKLEDDVREKIKKSLSSIPETLRKEREQIEDKLRKLPKEITEQSETRPN